MGFGLWTLDTFAHNSVQRLAVTVILIQPVQQFPAATQSELGLAIGFHAGFFEQCLKARKLAEFLDAGINKDFEIEAFAGI